MAQGGDLKGIRLDPWVRKGAEAPFWAGMGSQFSSKQMPRTEATQAVSLPMLRYFGATRKGCLRMPPALHLPLLVPLGPSPASGAPDQVPSCEAGAVCPSRFPATFPASLPPGRAATLSPTAGHPRAVESLSVATLPVPRVCPHHSASRVLHSTAATASGLRFLVGEE